MSARIYVGIGFGFSRGMNDSLKMNRDQLKIKRQPFEGQNPIFKSKEKLLVKDPGLSPEEKSIVLADIRRQGRRARRNELIVLCIFASVIVGAVVIVQCLA